ncbi:putative oxalate decarboxylase [Colletotrichum tanaceti]|nr:putative oxalate decarboxylase [Colletotrichum tanaceti]
MFKGDTAGDFALAREAEGLLANPAQPPPQNAKRDAQYNVGQPIDTNSKGGLILGGINNQVDRDNPDNLGQQPTDNGVVPNLKWRFSDSNTRILNGGWVREQVIQNLPQSHDIVAAQQHLKKGAIREPHWYKVAEWGIVYSGSVMIGAVGEDGKSQVEKLNYGDNWYFPKGAAHYIQAVDDENGYLLVFDEADLDKIGNFGVDRSVFDKLPTTNPYILNGTVANTNVTVSPDQYLSGNSSFVHRTFEHPPEVVPGNGSEFRKVDSTNFPISKTIAATIVTLKPGGLRELHWHPNAEKWLYFHKGTARAAVFIGSTAARTFDQAAGNTFVAPDNSAHYIENTSDTEDLAWIELYKSDRVVDISLAQWLVLTPPEIVAQTLKVPVEFVGQLKKEKNRY